MTAAKMNYIASVCSADPDLISEFMLSACGPDGKSVTLKELADICLEPVPPADLAQESAAGRLRDADFCVLLVRHLDAGSLERVRQVIRKLHPQAAQNLNVTICRKPAEHEYKISCTKCNRNVIVLDALAHTRVRCPHCHDVFTVKGQTDILRDELVLNASQLVRKVTLDDPASCREILSQMIGQVAQKTEAIKRQTMRIELPDV